MKSQILFGLIILVILCSGAAMYLYNTPIESSVTGKSEYTVTASEIFTEFELNEDAANGKYLNRIVSVVGQVTDIDAADSVSVDITLGTGNGIFGVKCRVTNLRETSGLRNGQNVKIKGLCTGMLMDVILVKCVIEKK